MSMKAENLSAGFAWLCGAAADELFYHWLFDDGDLWWSERSAVPFPGYWGT
jgi:hypothetical protein